MRQKLPVHSRTKQGWVSENGKAAKVGFGVSSLALRTAPLPPLPGPLQRALHFSRFELFRQTPSLFLRCLVYKTQKPQQPRTFVLPLSPLRRLSQAVDC